MRDLDCKTRMVAAETCICDILCETMNHMLMQLKEARALNHLCPSLHAKQNYFKSSNSLIIWPPFPSKFTLEKAAKLSESLTFSMHRRAKMTQCSSYF